VPVQLLEPELCTRYTACDAACSVLCRKVCWYELLRLSLRPHAARIGKNGMHDAATSHSIGMLCAVRLYRCSRI
jgi:hypothetical protein